MSIEIAIGILTVSGREKYLNKTLSMLNENLVVFKDIKPLMRAHVYALRALSCTAHRQKIHCWTSMACSWTTATNPQFFRVRYGRICLRI